MLSISVKMDDDLKNRLTNYAKSNDLSIAQVVRKAITEFLNKYDEKE